MPETLRLGRVVRPLSLIAITFFVSSAFAQTTPTAPSGSPSSQPPKIKWLKGPQTVKLGGVGELRIPAGYEFADGDGARIALEQTGNPPNGNEVGVLQPINDAPADNWIAYFDFNDDGYVKDDGGSNIDAPALLDSMKKGAEEENEERKKRGWKPFHLTGWQTQPFYDSSTHNLTWGTLGKTDDPKDGQTINYATRILGRRGVMRTDLVIDPSQTAAIPRFQQLMTGFTFTQGNRYAEFVQGDKVAAYGLTALIAGGATAVALKTGLFAKLLALLAGLWKLIAVAFAALMSRIKNIIAAIKKRFSRNRESDEFHRPQE